MNHWTIQSIPLGAIFVPKDALTVGLDKDKQIWVPYLCFYLTDGKKRVLVDCGISESFIVDGKAWGGFPAYGGTEEALKSFEKAGVDPKSIEYVLYTHLHNDHTGCAHLFQRAVHVFQWDEWKDFIDPLPSMRLRGDYDPAMVLTFQRLDCRRIEGDMVLHEGLSVYKTSGHTGGSMCISVQTAKGNYFLTGDTAHLWQNMYSQVSEMVTLEGEPIKTTPAPEVYGLFVPSSLVYDHYAWYKSMYRLRTLCPDKAFALPGHEPTIAWKTFPA